MFKRIDGFFTVVVLGIIIFIGSTLFYNAPNIDQVSNAVVLINVETPKSSDPNDKPASGSGTGFLIGENLFITNAHVVTAEKSSITNAENDHNKIQLYHKDSARAFDVKLIALDVRADIAILSIPEWKEYVKEFGKQTPLVFEKSIEPAGSTVYAIGNPLGFGWLVSKGIIRTDRYIDAPAASLFYLTDASISPGNSGGPLLNSDFHVVGINSKIYSSAERAGGYISFSIRSDFVQKIVKDLQESHSARRGISGLGIDINEKTGETFIKNLKPNSPAYTSKMWVNDVLLKICSKRGCKDIHTPDDIFTEIFLLVPGDWVTYTYKHPGTQNTLTTDKLILVKTE